MKSIKPGRGPSGMNAIGSVIAVIFGIFWTVLASSMTSGAGIIGIIFPLFGILFVILGIVQAIYHFKNATGKNRFSAFDITDNTEEVDPLNEKFGKTFTADNNTNQNLSDNPSFCPFCGDKISEKFEFCPKCGKELPW